jgi:hypothetical protein
MQKKKETSIPNLILKQKLQDKVTRENLDLHHQLYSLTKVFSQFQHLGIEKGDSCTQKDRAIVKI